jgi:23S rRNA pseudouridine1911/1915/1917 synthase
MRLDVHLAQQHPEHSRSTWAKYIKSGFISVNGKTATRSDLVASGDKIDINLPKNDKKSLDLPVIYEDDNVIVLDKPAGILTHSKGALNDEFTVSDFIRTHSVQNGVRPRSEDTRFGIVHRLDRATSGVIIGAKNPETLKYLQRQFSERKAKKTYYAVVEKAPKESEFRIDLPIARNPKHPSQFRVDPKGKPAVTDVKVVQSYIGGRALLELKPQTGRTHQLRVHLAYIGSPIVGESVYTTPQKPVLSAARSDLVAKVANGDRMMLHASELEITIPGGERRVFKAKLPKEFNGKLDPK